MVAVARFSVVVSPGAARSEVVGRHGDAWKVRVAAPAERGRANTAVEALLRKALGVPVRVVVGATARRKVLEAEGLRLGEIERRLEAAS
jgi:uncharacterized protein (TIGR00251 family)